MNSNSLSYEKDYSKVQTISSKFLSRIESAGVVLSALFIVIIMLLTTVDVILRYIFSSPITGVYELESMMLVAIAYLGLSYIQSKRSHIAMDAFSANIHGPWKLILNLLNDVIFLLIGILFTWQMGISTLQAWQIGDIYPGSLIRIPIWPAYLVIVLGIGLTSLRLILCLIFNPLWQKRPGFNRAWSILGVLISVLLVSVIVVAIIISQKMAFSPIMVGFISIALFFVLLLAGTSVGASMAMIGIFGFWMLLGTSSALNMAGTVPFSSADHYDMTVMPLFIIMGSFGSLAGFAKAAFDTARQWVGRIPGGIVQATVVGAAAFAAANGSSIASCAVLAKVAVPEMLKQGVNKGMAIGAVASAATLAIMIPPSGQFVVYGMITGTSIGQLLIAGIIPGLIGAVIIMITVAIRVKLDPKVIPQTYEHYTWKERITSIPQSWGILIIAIVVMGGIYTGIATPTEAGAIGAFVAFITLIITKKTKWDQIRNTLFEAGGISSSVLFILIGGMTFGYMISVSQLPQTLANWVVHLQVHPLIILICIIIVYIILGCFVDTLSGMIITLPIIFPIILGLGFSPIWFGVLMVQNAEIGAITPPFGMNLFVLKSTLENYTLTEIFKGVAWFIAPLIVTMAIYIAFPQVSLWLPSLMIK